MTNVGQPAVLASEDGAAIAAGSASDLSLRLTVISPAAARTLLSRPHALHRRRDEAVQLYSQAMRDGCWLINGMPIILSQDRTLLDGMQRLLACLETGIPLQTFLAENVADATYASIDQHQRRTFSALLKSLGYGHSHFLAHLVFQLVRYDEGTLAEGSSPAMSWVGMVRLLARTPKLQQAVVAAVAMTTSPLPLSVRSAILFMGYQVNPRLTDRLLDAIQYPSRYASNEPGVLLHEELQRGKGASGDNHLLALTIKALNAMRHSGEIRRLTWHGKGSGHRLPEPFPILIGYSGLGAFETPAHDQENATAEVAWRVETITPEAAKRYLTEGRPARSHNSIQVDALADSIRQGRWDVNAQPICFSSRGILLNGQNRLLAVLAAGQSIDTVVVTGLQEEAAASFDMSERRKVLSDQQAKFGDQALATAMANLLWRFESKAADTRHKRASAAEVREILQQHPRLIELRGFARKMVEYGRSSVMGYGAYVIERDDPQLAATFLQALSTGADLSAGHPILALRLALQRLRRENASQAEQLNALIAGWRRYKAHPIVDQHGRHGTTP